MIKSKIPPSLWFRTTQFIHQYLDYVILLGFIGFSWWLMRGTLGYEQGSFIMDGKLHSDFAAHLPLIRSFSLGFNFPPEYPFYAGEPIRYHYLFYLIVGLGERIGLNLVWVLNILSAAGLSLLLWMIYKITRLFFQKVLLGLLAVGLFLLNPSLSWVEYFDQHGWTLQALKAIPEQIQFASFGPWSGRLVSAFWTLNIYTNQRHLALSYGLILALIYPLLLTLKNPKIKLPVWAKIGILTTFALFPLLHQAGYLMLMIFCGMWFALYWPRCQTLFRTYLVGGFLSLLTFFFLTTGSGQNPHLQVGYLSLQTDWQSMLIFWFYNLGFYLFLIPILLWWSKRQHNFFLLIFYVFFLIANLFRLSTDMINNHKLVNFFVIGLSIATAGLIGYLWSRSKLSTLIFASILIPLLTFGGVVDFFPIVNDTYGEVKDYPNSEVEGWILNSTKPSAQFLTTSYIYNPASMVGRKIFLDYGYHAWSMGYKDQTKRALLPQLFSPTIPLQTWCQLMTSQKLTHIIVWPNENSIEDGRILVTESVIINRVPATFVSQDGWRVWTVNSICR